MCVDEVRVGTLNLASGRDATGSTLDPVGLRGSLAGLDVDVLAVQEVDSAQPRSHSSSQPATVAAAIGAVDWQFAPTLDGTPSPFRNWRPVDPPVLSGAGEEGVAPAGEEQPEAVLLAGWGQDPIAPIASKGFAALDAGDEDGFTAAMHQSIPMAVQMFEAPADRYKVGTVFVARLSGHQDHVRMLSEREGSRSLQLLADLFVLTDELILLPDSELAAHRMRLLLAAGGVA